MKKNDEVAFIDAVINELNGTAIATPGLGSMPFSVWWIIVKLLDEAIQDTFKDDRFRSE